MALLPHPLPVCRDPNTLSSPPSSRGFTLGVAVHDCTVVDAVLVLVLVTSQPRTVSHRRDVDVPVVRVEVVPILVAEKMVVVVHIDADLVLHLVGSLE